MESQDQLVELQEVTDDFSTFLGLAFNIKDLVKTKTTGRTQPASAYNTRDFRFSPEIKRQRPNGPLSNDFQLTKIRKEVDKTTITSEQKQLVKSKVQKVQSSAKKPGVNNQKTKQVKNETKSKEVVDQGQKDKNFATPSASASSSAQKIDNLLESKVLSDANVPSKETKKPRISGSSEQRASLNETHFKVRPSERFKDEQLASNAEDLPGAERISSSSESFKEDIAELKDSVPLPKESIKAPSKRSSSESGAPDSALAQSSIANKRESLENAQKELMNTIFYKKQAKVEDELNDSLPSNERYNVFREDLMEFEMDSSSPTNKKESLKSQDIENLIISAAKRNTANSLSSFQEKPSQVMFSGPSKGRESLVSNSANEGGEGYSLDDRKIAKISHLREAYRESFDSMSEDKKLEIAKMPKKSPSNLKEDELLSHSSTNSKKTPSVRGSDRIPVKKASYAELMKKQSRPESLQIAGIDDLPERLAESRRESKTGSKKYSSTPQQSSRTHPSDPIISELSNEKKYESLRSGSKIKKIPEEEIYEQEMLL